VEEGKKDVEQAARSDPQRKEYLLGPLKSAKERNEIFIGYTSNATNFLRLKNYQFAIEDLGEAIRMEPMSAEARVVRGVAKMQARRPDAIYDFQSVIDIEKGKGEFSPYAVIYGNLASRLVKDDPSAKRLLTDAAGKFSGDGWPRPVVRFLRGEIKEADVLKAARDDDQRTEAHCYLGLDHALKGHRPEAIAHYRWVKDHNKQTLFEYTVAVAELERLERAPGKPTR